MNKQPHILVVEDDDKIAALLTDYFSAAGFRSTQLANGQAALDYLRSHAVDLVTLDLMLPGLDGVAVCQQLRGFSQVPVIMLTARVDEIDRLLGLETGADDYVCKPFSPREVVARVKVHLRRSQQTPQPTGAAFVVDRERMQILHGGAAVALTPVEFRLLAELIDNPSRVYSRQQLLDFAHEDQRDINDRTIDSHIKNIRRKLPQSECLQSVYGVGYRFEPPL
ncbi:response regulator [Massilia sp. TS11]|uniref:response regulator n=1 Tax=Massilia sp. TS11 TaxID=2908003 RepID=UPI001EDAD5D0|nr:response regulator [Massilia sp. TS11]MCG2585704.1 response regulator [Massilia sp. TS11]